MDVKGHRMLVCFQMPAIHTLGRIYALKHLAGNDRFSFYVFFPQNKQIHEI